MYLGHLQGKHYLESSSDQQALPDESGQVSGGLDVLADAKVPGLLLKERIDDSLHLLPLDGQGGGCHLLSLPLLAFLVDHLAIG